MTKIKFDHCALVFIVLLTMPFLMGMAMIGVKQLSRNNINEETLSTINLCQTTEKDIVELFRKPTEDFIAHQGEYMIYTYKGFSGRAGMKTQVVEFLLNSQNVVVNFKLNDEGGEPMADKCGS